MMLLCYIMSHLIFFIISNIYIEKSWYDICDLLLQIVVEKFMQQKVFYMIFCLDWVRSYKWMIKSSERSEALNFHKVIDRGCFVRLLVHDCIFSVSFSIWSMEKKMCRWKRNQNLTDLLAPFSRYVQQMQWSEDV